MAVCVCVCVCVIETQEKHNNSQYPTLHLAYHNFVLVLDSAEQEWRTSALSLSHPSIHTFIHFPLLSYQSLWEAEWASGRGAVTFLLRYRRRSLTHTSGSLQETELAGSAADGWSAQTHTDSHPLPRVELLHLLCLLTIHQIVWISNTATLHYIQ